MGQKHKEQLIVAFSRRCRFGHTMGKKSPGTFLTADMELEVLNAQQSKMGLRMSPTSPERQDSEESSSLACG